LKGNAIICESNLEIPTSNYIRIISDGVLDGQGNKMILNPGAKIVIDNDVTLTLRNINWINQASTEPVEMKTASSGLALQNVATKFDRDFSFTQGKLFIHDDVFITGTSKFSYAATSTSFIASHSTLYFDKGVTFSYSPRLNSRHTLSERNLIKMLDKTSELYFNNCTLQLPDSGWQVKIGALYFENEVILNGSTSEEKSFEWGDGTTQGDVDIRILSGAYINNSGYVYYNSSN